MTKILGVQLLRMILSFWIVIFHCYKTENITLHKYLFEIKPHVPCFILISFYFSFNTFSKRNINKIKSRFERIVIPYFIFPIIILAINNLLFTFHPNWSVYKRIITFTDLKLQFIIGREFIGVFWFQTFLILSTLLFVIISFLFKEKFLLILEILFLFFYIIQYSNINFIFFCHYSHKIHLCIGCYADVLPMAFAGCIIASNRFFDLNNKKRTFFFSLIGLFTILKYDIFSNIKNFGYGGIKNHLAAILLFIIFYLLPINDYKSDIFKTIINKITNYTQGIYSLHLIIKEILDTKITCIKEGSFLRCLFIYILSYLISFIGEKITKKSKLVYLFV